MGTGDDDQPSFSVVPADDTADSTELFARERLLGTSPFAAVYLARASLHEEPVVVKDYNMTIALAERMASFRNEVGALMLLRGHPSAPRYITSCRTATRMAIMMSYVPGCALDSLVGKPASYSPAEAMQWLISVASVVRLLHKRGLAYQDFSPANIIITPARRAVLIDYGSVRPFGQPAVYGTPGFFVNPRDATVPDLDASYDVFCLGCIALCLMVGPPPADQPDLGFDAIPRIEWERRMGQRWLLSAVTRDRVARLIASATHRSPEMRIQSMAELADRLREFGVRPKDRAAWGSHALWAAAAIVAVTCADLLLRGTDVSGPVPRTGWAALAAAAVSSAALVIGRRACAILRTDVLVQRALAWGERLCAAAAGGVCAVLLAGTAGDSIALSGAPTSARIVWTASTVAVTTAAYMAGYGRLGDWRSFTTVLLAWLPLASLLSYVWAAAPVCAGLTALGAVSHAAMALRGTRLTEAWMHLKHWLRRVVRPEKPSAGPGEREDGAIVRPQWDETGVLTVRPAGQSRPGQPVPVAQYDLGGAAEPEGDPASPNRGEP